MDSWKINYLNVASTINAFYYKMIRNEKHHKNIMYFLSKIISQKKYKEGIRILIYIIDNKLERIIVEAWLQHA